MIEKEKDFKKICKCKQYVVGFGQKALLVKHKPFLMKQKTFPTKETLHVQYNTSLSL